MSKCNCGCEAAASNDFLPGHDQKLRAILEQKVGGLLALRTLLLEAEAHAKGETSCEDLAKAARRVFWKS